MIAQGEAPRSVGLKSRLVLLAVAGVLGLTLGARYGGHGTAFDLGLKLVALTAATVAAVEVLRTAPDKRLWLAPFLMAIVLSLPDRFRLLSTSLAVAVLAAWAALLAASMLRRRTVALCCVAACAVTLALRVLTGS